MVPFQVSPISNGAFYAVMGNRLEGMRLADRLQAVATAASPYVSPNKGKGELTPRQIALNESRTSGAKRISENAQAAAKEVRPPPPSPTTMLGLRQMVTEVADRIYAEHPVPQVPVPSIEEVIRSYQRVMSATRVTFSPQLNQLVG